MMSSAEYSKIKYPIHKLKPGESVFDLSDLQPLKEILSEQSEMEKMCGLDPEFVMKYIILMNSPGSPAIAKYPHLGKRKTFVLGELNVSTNEKGKYSDEIHYLTLNKIPAIVRKISIFRSLQKPVDFAIGLNAEEELFDLLAPSAKSEGVTKETDLSEQEKKVRRDLIETTRKQYDAAMKRLTEFTLDRTEQQDMQEFMAQTYLMLRYEERLISMPAPKMPHLQQFKTIHKD